MQIDYNLDAEDRDLVALTSSASLDRSPKKNWVENAGQLPPYVRKLARAIEKDGHDLSSAIAIAISRIKKWAAGGDGVDADTKAKSVKALAQWAALKAKNKAKKVALAHTDSGETYLMLTNVPSFNLDIVREAWNSNQRALRNAQRELRALQGKRDVYVEEPYNYVREVWTDYIIVTSDMEQGQAFRIPYTVSDGQEVTFGEPTPVKQTWVDLDEPLTDTEKALLGLA